MLWAQSTTKDYTRAEHKLHSISKSFISQVITPQTVFFEPIYISRALNAGTCIQQGDLFYSAGLHRKHLLATANTAEIGRGFGEKCRWMDRTDRNKQGKKSLAVSVACMAIYWPSPGFRGRTFKLCVLDRWDFNFCVRRSPTRGDSEHSFQNKVRAYIHW